MACALGSSGWGLCGRSGSYDSPYPCSSETYYPYQEHFFGGSAGQQRHPYAHMLSSHRPSFEGMRGSGFSSFGPSNPYTRPQGYPDTGTNLGMGAGIGSGIGCGSRGFGFPQSPYAGLHSLRGSVAGSMHRRDHRSRTWHHSSRRGLAGARGRYPSSQSFDDEGDSDDEDYAPFIKYRYQRQRQAPFGYSQQPTYGMRPVPRQYYGYDDYDDYDDNDDEFDDCFAYPARRRQRYY
ncbi:hypothetical protein J1614_006606 [Plenodomus biglobosus]|nr:hypothetical protein J1614_006606 [Plenodomus biglobosus]